MATDEELVDGFWSKIAPESDGDRRDNLDKARMALAQQLLAAMLNVEAFGTDDGGAVNLGKDAFCTGSRSDVIMALGELTLLNEGSDEGTVDESPANPKLAQTTADIEFWDDLP